MLLLCYDGSADAQAAIDLAARAMPGVEAAVLTVWEPFLETIIRSSAMAAGWGLSTAGAEDYGRIDQASEKAALDTATEGAQRATDAGLLARPRVAARHGGVADSILVAAAEVDADVIVVGTRGRGDVKSFLLGSVSHHLVEHADRAVVVVPSQALAERRRSVHAAEDYAFASPRHEATP